MHTRFAIISHEYTHYTDKRSDTDTDTVVDTDTVRLEIDLSISSIGAIGEKVEKRPHDKPSERQLTEPKMSTVNFIISHTHTYTHAH